MAKTNQYARGNPVTTLADEPLPSRRNITDGDKDEIQALLRHYSEPLPGTTTEAFGELFDRYGDAKVVLIGEASHGTSDFYRTRAAITQRLIERHGFNIVAVEADWPDAAHVDRCVRDLAYGPAQAQAFARFPTWMWRNTDVVDFSHWLHGHNRGVAPAKRVEFRGLDVYSMRNSIGEVLSYLDSNAPELAREARRRYGCLTPWQDEPALYGHFVERDGVHLCEEAVVAQLHSLLDDRLKRFAHDDEASFNATQNARVVRAAEQYYRAMYRGSKASWNLRDTHMFSTLQTVLANRSNGAKAVVWAHNSHIGNAAATEMGWRGELNIGQLCRSAYGNDAVLIGMSTNRGHVAAADEWDGPMQVKAVLPAREDSWERQFRDAAISPSLTDWRAPDREKLRSALARPLLERAIGVIYRPATERLSHYFEAVLSEQFDAMVWIENTAALTPLPAGHTSSHEEATCPFGL